MILFIFLISCVSASDNSLNNHFINLTNKNYNLVNFINRSFSLLNSSNSIKDNLNNLINTSSNNTNINKSFINNSSIYYNKSNLVNLSIDKDNVSLVNNKNNRLLYNDLTNKDVNISKNIKSDNITVVNNHELSKFNNTTDFNKSSVINVYPDTSNLTNNSSIKYNKNNVLFNGSSDNLNQFNKTFKGFGLDKDSSVNDKSIVLSDGSISKELNSSEINNISNNSSKDNPIHVSESKQDKDYIMLLIPTILVLLGAIILYKLKK